MSNLGKKVRNIFYGTLIAGGVAGVVGFPHFFRNEYTVTVTDKETKRNRMRETPKDYYLVFTELDDGTIKTFKNKDSLLEWKFRSSDFQAKLKVGETYNINTYGLRIPVLSRYQNIVAIDGEKKFHKAKN